VRAWLTAGDRRVWSAGAITSAVMLALIGWQLLKPRDLYTGTNSVRPRAIAAVVPPRAPLCIPDLDVPAGTGRVELDVITEVPQPRLDVAVRTANGVFAGSTPGPRTRGQFRVAVPIRKTPAEPHFVKGTVCARAQAPLSFTGIIGSDADLPPRIGQRPVQGRVAVWFRPPAGERHSYLSRLGPIVDRAALFRPGIVGPWTYVVVIAALPVLWFSALRLLAVANARPRRRLLTAVVVLALANFAAWSLITPAFDTPDEPEHFAYGQYLAETGKAPARSMDERAPLSQEQSIALQAIKIYSYQEGGDGRPPWSPADEHAWERRVAALPAPPHQDNGGGASAATVHAPAYYSLLVPGYLLTESQSPFSQLTAMRLTSALLGALTVALAFLILAQLFPRHPVAWVAGALLVAFEPMFGFMSGAVNNDAGVNAAAAAVVLVLLVALRRSLTVPLAAGAGALIAIAPLFKGTAYTFYVVAGLALVLLLMDRRSRRAAPLVALAAGFFGVQIAWAVVAAAMDRALFTTPTGDSPVQNVSFVSHPKTYLSYLWQVFLPPLPFMTDLHREARPFFHIYVERTWAAFGWIANLFPRWVYDAILAFMGLAAVLGGISLWRERAVVRARWKEALVLVAVAIGVVMGVEAAFTTLKARPAIAEQGRYVFTAITVYSAFTVFACLAFGRRLFPVALSVAVTLVVGLSVASQLFMLASVFA
jgi:Predicted membrane protein (DUF2142)